MRPRSDFVVNVHSTEDPVSILACASMSPFDLPRQPPNVLQTRKVPRNDKQCWLNPPLHTSSNSPLLFRTLARQ